MRLGVDTCLVFIDGTEPALRLGGLARTVVIYKDGSVSVVGEDDLGVVSGPGGCVSGESTITGIPFRFDTATEYIVAAHNQGVPIRPATRREELYQAAETRWDTSPRVVGKEEA